MNCYCFNERIYSSLSNFMERKKDDLQSKISSNDAYPKEEEDKIIELKSEKTKNISEYRNNFVAVCKQAELDRQELFDQIFRNQGYGMELLTDHEGVNYYGNFITTYDLTLNHLKKGICGPVTRRYKRGKYLMPIDLIAIYPNLTNWGLKEKVYKEQEKVISRPSIPVSEYKSEYSCILYAMSENK